MTKHSCQFWKPELEAGAETVMVTSTVTVIFLRSIALLLGRRRGVVKFKLSLHGSPRCGPRRVRATGSLAVTR